MNKLIQALLLGILGLVVLTAAAPAITRIVHSLVPLVALLGVFWICRELIDYYSRR
jgi:hypothetical protein